MNAELARALVLGRWGKYIAESLRNKEASRQARDS
jgi:hypothetical protein